MSPTLTRSFVLSAALWTAVMTSPAIADESYGPWEVRRSRTTDSATAGGFPTWRVTFSGAQDAPDVRVDGDRDGAARGTILIGRRVTVPQDGLIGLDFSYATHCDLDNRSGSWQAVIIDVQAWDKLGTHRRTEVVFNPHDRRACLAVWGLISHTGVDVHEPRPWHEPDKVAFAAQSRRLAGQDVVLAAAWTAYHTVTEWATLSGVRLVTFDEADVAKPLFDRLDLTRPELRAVKQAVQRGDYESAARGLARYFRRRTEPAYPGDPRLQPEHKVSERRLEEADAALENRFIGQGSYGLQKVPDDIDWSYNPGEDREWTWQFNRHSAWRALGEAYLATGDEKYARKWVALLRDWVAENPPGTPWSWRTLEAGIRAQGWIPVYLSFINSPSFAPEDHVTFLSSLADHAEYLLPEGRFRSGSNWGQTESRGLLHIGTFFPEFKDAALWRDTAWKRLEGEMFIQVLEDGAQVELTTSYHQGCIRGFVNAAEIAALGGKEPSPDYWARLEKMYEYTMFLQKPDGRQPMLGDSWPGNTRNIVAEGGRRFSRDDMLYVGTDGEEGTKPDSLDTQLPAAGYYVMRTDWTDPEAIYLLTDIAHRWGGGHQQPDALQINLYGFGETLLPDSGSYLYYGSERQRFARTSSHSTVTVDDRNQNHSPAKLHCFSRAEALSFVDGSHEGYEGITHRRQVLFARPTGEMPPYFIVIDKLTGEGRHTADQYFHFLPAPLDVNTTALEARTALPEGPNLLVRGLMQENVTLQEVESWVSFDYGKKQERPAVRFRQDSDLPVTFITLLVPYEGGTAPELEASQMRLDGAEGAVEIRVQGPGFEDLLFAANEPTDMMLGRVEVHGRAGLVRLDAAGEQIRAAVVEGGEG